MGNNSDIIIDDTHSCFEEVTIDLASSERPLVNIGREWEITVKPKKSLSNLFGSKKKIERTVYISISNIRPDDKLEYVTNADMSMFSVIVAGVEYNLPEGKEVPVELTDENNSFSLHFNPNTIRDCKEKQRKTGEHRSYPITMCLNTNDDKGNAISSRDVTVNITFAHMTGTPKVECIMREPSIKFSADMGIERIGEVVISNENTLMHLPDIGCQCEMIVKDDNSTVTDGNIWLDFNDAKGASVEHDRQNPNMFRIKRLQEAAEGADVSEVRIPIYMYVSKIGNPCNSGAERIVYKFEFIVKYWNCNETGVVNQLNVPVKKFTMWGNRQEPNISKIDVYDQQKDRHHELIDGKSVEISRVYFLPGQNLRAVIPMTVYNSANEGVTGAGVAIRNFAYNVEFPLGTEIKYASRRGDAKTMVSLEGPESVLLPNKPDSHQTWQFIFSGDAVKELYRIGRERNYKVDIKIVVTFDYCLDAEGKSERLPSYFQEHHKTFRSEIVMPVYQQPNPQWLAVDFGTSAIVSKFGDRIINLHQEKKKLYDDSEDAYEQGTPFLSSNILFRSVSRGSSHSQLMINYNDVPQDLKYSHLAVCLSPTSTYEKANISTILPCLKLIVGYDLLPNIDNYRTYTYHHLDEDGNLLEGQSLVMQEEYEGETEDVYTPLAKVDTIFSEVYSELFTYFLSPAIEADARKINQLILSIPNTYTPAHMHRIRNIVKGALKGLNIRTINFVSESDAVACYYQRHWTDINRLFNRQDSNALKKKEIVLVYDMGAGTLDVTLFVKSMETASDGSDRIIIDVLGKIGIAKAGNYLDALIAQLLAKKIAKLAPFVDPDQIDSGDRVKAALQLKTIIKNDIKPLLSTPNAKYVFKRDMSLGVKEDITINLEEDIKLMPEFQSYIKEVTEDFLNNFFGFFDIYAKQKIDTVLMSGRSIKLKPIQEALHTALRKWSAPEMKLIDISSLTDENSEFDRSKTVVVEGAIDYASLFGASDSSVEFRSRNIVACYGILYRDTHGAVQYAELLNPRITPHKNIVNSEGMTVHTYETPEQTFDLSNTETLQLVQTFSSDTRTDWINGNHEYITPISEIIVNTLPSRKNVRIQLRVDRYNTMALYINGMERNGITTSKIDINSRSNRFSLWPVLKAAKTNA